MQTIGIIGSGTMGSGIAEVAALANFHVLLHDTSPTALRTAFERIKQDFGRRSNKGRIGPTEATEALSRIEISRDFRELGEAELIIEAVVEELPVKKDLFRRLDAMVAPDAILATNTATLSVSAIAAFTKSPDSVVGMHFFNPPVQTKLVEIVRGNLTSEETIGRVSTVVLAMDKVPVVCRDTPGFIVDRVTRPF